MSLVSLPKGSWWDWELFSWNAWELRLAAGYDLSYHHGLELVFAGVGYVACPVLFHDPRFREPTQPEQDTVRRYIGAPAPVVVAFDIDSGSGDGVLPCIVAAQSVEVVTGLFQRQRPDRLLGLGAARPVSCRAG
jgi:hypothetical protein